MENNIKISTQRRHPWSFIPGGAEVIIIDENGGEILYDKVKDVDAYLSAAFTNNPTLSGADITDGDGEFYHVSADEIYDKYAKNKINKKTGNMEESIQSLAIRFVKSRTEKDFKLVYDRLKPGLLQHVYNILKNESAAEDVVADSFIKMWLKIHQYNMHWNFSTWAYKIARNEAMQWIRKNGNIYSIESMGGEQIADKLILSDAFAEDNGIDFIQNPDWYFDETEDKRVTLYNKVLDEIEALPELYKNIMKDREIDGMKYEDISEKYGLELNTVKTRIKRAREKIIKTTLESIED